MQGDALTPLEHTGEHTIVKEALPFSRFARGGWITVMIRIAIMSASPLSQTLRGGPYEVLELFAIDLTSPLARFVIPRYNNVSRHTAQVTTTRLRLRMVPVASVAAKN